MDKKETFAVPDLYFDSLKDRLTSITGEQRPSVLERVKPYLATAASLAVILTAGISVFRLAVREADDVTEDVYGFFSTAYNEFYYMDEDTTILEEVSEDEVREYLIESGVTVNHLTYTAYYDDEKIF